MSDLISCQTGEHPKPCSLQLQYLIEHENFWCADIDYITIAIIGEVLHLTLYTDHNLLVRTIQEKTNVNSYLEAVHSMMSAR